jgi:hypothetical protein
MSTTKDKFIQCLTRELNRVNKDRLNSKKQIIDVCFIISIIDKEIENCNEFIKDIEKHEYIIYININPSAYTDGDCEIYLDSVPYTYQIDFLYIEKYLGYCICSPEHLLYNKKYNCTGINCDWSVPKFTLRKIETLYCGIWKENQRDYWKYEEEFRQKESNLIKEIEDYNKHQEIERLEKLRDDLQKKINELKN